MHRASYELEGVEAWILGVGVQEGPAACPQEFGRGMSCLSMGVQSLLTCKQFWNSGASIRKVGVEHLRKERLGVSHPPELSNWSDGHGIYCEGSDCDLWIVSVSQFQGSGSSSLEEPHRLASAFCLGRAKQKGATWTCGVEQQGMSPHALGFSTLKGPLSRMSHMRSY